VSEKKTPSSKSERTSAVDSREALLKAAQHVFSKKGFEGATVKDLADEAGVNVSLVSYHFGGKEGLYKTCLEGFGIERVEAAERMLKAPASREEFFLRMRLIDEDFVEVQVKNIETCKIVMRGIDTLDAATSEVFKKIFYRVFLALKNFVESARKEGLIAEDIDTEITTGLMFGSLMHIIRSQDLARVLKMPTLDDPKHAAKVIDQWINCFTYGLFQKPTRDGSESKGS
jgi:AcrR family transcriptional regulator